MNDTARDMDHDPRRASRPCHRAFRATAAAAALAALLSLSASAGPFMPAGHRAVPDEIVSLTGVRRMQLAISHLPDPLIAAGFDHAHVRQRLEAKLTAQGFEIVALETAEDPAVPRLVCHALMHDEPGPDDWLAYCLFADVVQRVHLPRLQRDLHVTTCTLVVTAKATRDRLLTVSDTTLEELVKGFVESVRTADAAAPGAGENPAD